MTDRRVPHHLIKTVEALEAIIGHAQTLLAALELLDDLGTRREVTTRPEDRDRISGGGAPGYANLDGDVRAKRLMRDVRKHAADCTNRLGGDVAAWGKLTAGPNPVDSVDRLPPAEHRRLTDAQFRRAKRVEEVVVDW